MAMERRVQFKVDEIGVSDLVGELLHRGLSYQEIAEEVERQTGQTVGKSSIARYNDGLQRRLEKIRAMRDTSDMMAAELKRRREAAGTDGDPDMGLSDLLLDVMSQNLLDKGTEEEIDAKELTFMASASAQVVGAKTRMEAVKQTERKRAGKAYDKICKELRGMLERADGELWTRVEAVLMAGRETVAGA